MPLTAALAKTLTMVLAGGKGDRLQPLTRDRAKPAVPFGGLYRIIDFTLSNCIHSGLRKIFVLTQYQARSLEEHIRFGWNFLPRQLGQFITMRPPHLGTTAKWYQGTADAIYQNIDAFKEDRPERVLILSGDHIYKMDYGRMLAEHLESDAAVTIAAIPVPREDARRLGVFKCAAGGRVLGFDEKPDDPRDIPGRPGWCLASMGIYLFDTDALIEQVTQDAANPDSSRDFGKDIIPQMIDSSKVFVHHYSTVGSSEDTYWRDIGTLESYYEANLDLCGVLPRFNLYDSEWPTYTRQHEPRQRPCSRRVVIESTKVLDSLLCPGVIVSDARVHQSILSYRVRVAKSAVVEDSILHAGVEVGEGARIRRAIVDKWSHIPAGTRIGYDPEHDAERFRVTDSGIVIVSRKYPFDELKRVRTTASA